MDGSTSRKRGRRGRFSERAGRNASERRAGLEKLNAEADPPTFRGSLPATGDATEDGGERHQAGRLRRGSGDGMCAKGSGCNTGSPVGGAHASPGNPRGPAWVGRVAERLGVPGKPSNTDGGKEPQFERNVGKGTGTLGPGASLPAPITVRKLQRAWHAKTKGALSDREERERGEAEQAVAPVAEPEAPGEVGEGRAPPGWATVAGPQSGTPASADGVVSRGRRQDLEQEPSAGNPHAGFGERGEETWSTWRLRHRH